MVVVSTKDFLLNPMTHDLVSNCCAWDFEPFGYEKDEGVWQERCLKCNKLCETLYISKQDIKNIHNLDSLTQEEKKP